MGQHIVLQPAPRTLRLCVKAAWKGGCGRNCLPYRPLVWPLDLIMKLIFSIFAGVLTLASAAEKPRSLPRLEVSENHRFLVTTEGKPFFYLGDTAWELFHRLDRKEAADY